MPKDCCRVCQGKCCKEGKVAVSLEELNRLPNPRARKINDDLYRLVDSPCQYLGENGCTLDPEVKPIACVLYPFYPTADGLTSSKDAVESFIVKTTCPYWNSFNNEDLEEVKKVFNERRSEFKTPLQALPDGYKYDKNIS